MNFEELKKRYGKPIFHIDLSGYSKNEKIINDIPDSVAVFATSRIPTGIIVYGKLRGGEWIPNYGQRQLIKRLLTLNKVI